MTSGSEPSELSCSRARVDSASPGSQEEISLSCSSVRPPASGAANAASTSQNTRMTHLSRGWLTREANVLLMTEPLLDDGDTPLSRDASERRPEVSWPLGPVGRRHGGA